MNRTLSIILVVAGAWVSPTHAGSIPEANLTVRVVAEDGAPVASADVKLGFEGAEYGHNELKLGKTDHNGDFSALGRTLGIVFYSVHKDGYYDNLDSRYEFFKQEVNHWVPENPTCLVVLKRIIEPTPMYVRQVQLTFPVLNQAVGIDLDVGDWVAPHGKGRVADLFIRATCRFVDLNDFNSELSISFPKRLDGILAFQADQQRGSVLSSPQRAPDSGYSAALFRRISRSPAGGQIDTSAGEGTNYIFRVRCIEDEHGNLKEANYGKIYGEIRFGGFAQPKPSIAIWCYFNPKVNSRSLEFDTTKNLAGERIGKP